MSYFTFEHKKIYYKECGTGTPLLFLHGNTASSMMFYEAVEKYKDNFKVILIDFLGHGKSDRLDEFPADLWFYESQQVIAFLEEKQYTNVNMIGSSGGALVAINVALEAPQFVSKVIADSFEGEVPLKQFTENIVAEREISKQKKDAELFYQYMQGDDWERVVDNDTSAIVRHEKEIGKFFHGDLQSFKPDILLTGSRQDEFVSSISSDYFEKIYGEMLDKIGHGRMYLFDAGRHPAMLTNSDEFYKIGMDFLLEGMMEANSKKDILKYAKDNIASFEAGSVSSNEIHFFEYDEKKYVLKTPLMVGDNLSPFWLMMKNVFCFTFEKQNTGFENVYNSLKDNPHIRLAPFIIADERAMIYEFVKGDCWTEDEFPQGKENANILGQYVGYNHRIIHKNCGIQGVEDVTDFFSIALSHMEECINAHWNSEEIIDKKMRTFFGKLKERSFESSRYSLMMADMSADQFLFDGENISACVDLDAYVIGPVEWELSFLQKQVSDWDSFKAGYETYQSMPAFEKMSDFFFFLMALNSYWNKSEIEMYWSNFFVAPFSCRK